MLSKIKSFGLVGIEGYPVDVEVDLNNGIPAYDVVGLPDASIKEGKDRIRSAIKHSGLEYPLYKITVNLAPADTKKEGPIYDLPIALGLLSATNQFPVHATDGYVILGELSLNGEVRKVNGILPMIISARENGFKKVSCHGLRHTYCSLLLSQNVPIQTVSKYLGHSDSTITLKVYSHFIPDTQEKVVNALNNLI